MVRATSIIFVVFMMGVIVSIAAVPSTREKRGGSGTGPTNGRNNQITPRRQGDDCDIGAGERSTCVPRTDCRWFKNAGNLARGDHVVDRYRHCGQENDGGLDSSRLVCCELSQRTLTVAPAKPPTRPPRPDRPQRQH